MSYGISDFTYRLYAIDPDGMPFEQSFSQKEQAEKNGFISKERGLHRHRY